MADDKFSAILKDDGEGPVIWVISLPDDDNLSLFRELRSGERDSYPMPGRIRGFVEDGDRVAFIPHIHPGIAMTLGFHLGELRYLSQRELLDFGIDPRNPVCIRRSKASQQHYFPGGHLVNGKNWCWEGAGQLYPVA